MYDGRDLNWTIELFIITNVTIISPFDPFIMFNLKKKNIIKFDWMTHFTTFSIPIVSFIVISVGNKIDCKLRMLMDNGILINIFKLYIY
jgi:hypothetical protein